MRLVATVFLWLVTTVLLAAAVPTMWAQRNVVSEDGYAALRQRFESATRSWASVHEANKLYKVLVRVHGRGELRGRSATPAAGGDGASESSPLFHKFHKMTGDLSRIYGLASIDTLSATLTELQSRYEQVQRMLSAATAREASAAVDSLRGTPDSLRRAGLGGR